MDSRYSTWPRISEWPQTIRWQSCGAFRWTAERWLALTLLACCCWSGPSASPAAADDRRGRNPDAPTADLAAPKDGDYASAVLAGGCFWCVETDFEKLPGVINVISGYSGGRTKQPTYSNYSAGGHREVVFIVYDPQQVSYAGLVEWLIKHVDPTDRGGSFLDRGPQYKPTIYYENEEERREAERVVRTIDGWRVFRSKINIAIEQREAFWLAEDYHQDYHHKQGLKYQFFRAQSGRDSFVTRHWGTRSGVLEIPGSVPEQAGVGRDQEDQPATQLDGRSEEQPHWLKFRKLTPLELRKRLNPMQFHVTQENGTEPAFRNKYWDQKEAGIYVDILSGAPLFSSADKFDSGTGWPSFTKPLVGEYLVYLADHNPLLGTRTEVRSRISAIHLGHVFNDGPPLAGGKRYCMNSAALRFIPRDQMEEEGYGDFLDAVPEEQKTSKGRGR